MAERLYRLITFIVDICTPVLKQLLIKCAKEDTKITYTTLKVYMLSRKPDIIKLKAVSQENFQNVYPSPGLFVEGSLDVTLLASLLLNLLGTTLQPVETLSIKTIRDIRNLFLHKSCTDSVDENEFDSKWSDLKTNVLIIARFVGGADYEDSTISKIQDTMTNNLPNLDNSLRNWYQSVNTELRLRLTSMETTLNSTTAELSLVKTELSSVKAELTSIKFGIQSVEQQSKETKAASSKVETIVSNMSTKRINREGLECDRILVADPVADRIKENFHKMVREHKTDDISFQNLEDIKNILQKQHRVVITGGHDTPYLPVAIKVVENMGYDIRQCVEITDKDEWNIVRPADTKLVLCKYPFGRFTLDEQKARSMFTAFDSMLHSTRDSEETRMAFIIVSELEIVDAAIKIISQGTGHEFLEARIDMDVEDSYVQEASTADDTEFHLRLEATRAFRATRSPFAIPFATTIVEKAREMLRQDKYIILTGPMGCGKTCVALELASLYHPDRCLKLNRPEDIKLVSSRRTSLVLVEDFAGRNQYDEFRMQEWIEAFETLVQREHKERVDVVATCASECLEQFRNEIVRQHDHVLEVPYLTVVIHDKACGEQVKGQLSELTGGPDVHRPVSLTLQCGIPVQKAGEEKEPLYAGLTFLSDNRLVVVDNKNKKCHVLNDQLKNIGLPYCFTSSPHSVCILPGDRVAVTIDNQQIQILHVSNSNEITHVKTLNTLCYYDSISPITENMFAMSTFNDPRPARIVSLTGEICEESDFTDISLPSKVNKVGSSSCTYIQGTSTLVLTDTSDNIVYMYNRNDKTTCVVRDDRIRQPMGACVGPGNSIFVCSKTTSTIIHIASTGRIIDCYPVDMKLPRAVCMSFDGKKLAVSNSAIGMRRLHVYNIVT